MPSVLKRSSCSNPVILWRRQPLRNITFREFFKASHSQQRIDGSLANGTFPSASTIIVVLCGRRFTLFFVPVSVAPYFIIPSVINRRFCGVLLNYHFGPGEAEKSIDELLVPRCIYCFKHVSSICWPRSWRGRRFVFRAFFPPIYTMLIPHFLLISSFLIIERDKERNRRLLLHLF